MQARREVITAQLVARERKVREAVGAVDDHRNPARAPERADVGDGQHLARQVDDVTDEDQARARGDALGVAAHDVRGVSDRCREREAHELERAEGVLQRLFGVQSLSPATKCRWKDLDDIVAQGREFFAPEVADKRFAVRARRTTGHPKLPFASPDIERALGSALIEGAAGVDLDNPEVTAGVEVHTREVYFYARNLSGPGGLPMGVEGRALSLISGGFDSAVASWEVWKRGVGLDFVFFNLGGAEHERGATAVLEKLTRDWAYGDWPRLYTIDLRPQVEQLQAEVAPRYWQLALKALMYKAAAALAVELRRPALVTGEAIGQVSSQTLPNLVLLDGVVDVPVFRPLLTWNKEQIVAAARSIGSYDLSATVPEFCALAANHAMTRGKQRKFEEMLELLANMDWQQAVAERSVSEPRMPATVPTSPGALSVDALPEGATFVDLRKPDDFAAWHWPEALNLEYFKALKVYGSVDPSQTYVLYCEVGLKSAHLAELLRAEGVEAFHVPAGVSALRRVQERAAAHSTGS